MYSLERRLYGNQSLKPGNDAETGLKQEFRNVHAASKYAVTQSDDKKKRAELVQGHLLSLVGSSV